MSQKGADSSRERAGPPAADRGTKGPAESPGGAETSERGWPGDDVPVEEAHGRAGEAGFRSEAGGYGRADEAPDRDSTTDEAPDRDPTTSELGMVMAQRDEYLDALRRVQAEFENYKKRMLKQQTEHLERAAEGLVEKLLPVLDALELAVAHADGVQRTADGEGRETQETEDAVALRQVAGMLNDVLVKGGLERIDPRGEPFDPTAHDAVMHEEAEGGPLVSDVLRAGYRWRGRVLRPAMVKVQG